MVSKLFVIYDKIAQQSGPVFEARNVAVAQRQYKRHIRENIDPADMEEYSLLCLGRIDHDANLLQGYEIPEDVTQRVEDIMKIEEKIEDAESVQERSIN